MIYKGLKVNKNVQKTSQKVPTSLDRYKQGFLWSELIQINTGWVKDHEKKDCVIEKYGDQDKNMSYEAFPPGKCPSSPLQASIQATKETTKETTKVLRGRLPCGCQAAMPSPWLAWSRLTACLLLVHGWKAGETN